MADITPERRKQRLDEERRANATGGDYYDFKNLTSDVIRMPPRGDRRIGYKQVAYWINKKKFICNEGTHQKPGVIAKAVRLLRATGDKDAAEAATSLHKSLRTKYLMLIVQRSNPEKPMWMEAPGTIYNAIFEAFDKDGDDIDHPNRGRDVRISKKGSGLDTEYSVRILDQSPLAETKEERQAIRAAADQLDVESQLRADEEGAIEALKGIIAKPVWKLIAKDLLGDVKARDEDGDDADADDDGDMDDGDDEAPTQGKSTTKPKPATADDDEDAPVAKTKPATKVDEEDDDAPPAKTVEKKKTTAAAPAEDDDDAPPAKTKVAASVDDDDDAPAPKAKTAAAAKGGKAVILDDEEEDPKPARKAHQIDDDEE